MTVQTYFLTLKSADRSAHLRIPAVPQVIVGRRDPISGGKPDIDLEPFDGENLGVSRRHVALRLGTHMVEVKDLGSLNGTFINGIPLKPHKLYSAVNGDELRIGRMIFIIRSTVTENIDFREERLKLPQDNSATVTTLNPSVTTLEVSAVMADGAPPEATTKPTDRLAARKSTDPLKAEASSSLLRRLAETGKSDVQIAEDILRRIVINKPLTDQMAQIIAEKAAEHGDWKHSRRLAVLKVACSYGYVARDNAELLMEQRRLNKLQFGNLD
jgi:pSer/pThr/pTyr-binding forkhead associated (FHA) protein